MQLTKCFVAQWYWLLSATKVLIALYKKNKSLNLYKKNKGLKFWILFTIVVVQKPIQPMRVETTKTRNNKHTKLQYMLNLYQHYKLSYFA